MTVQSEIPIHVSILEYLRAVLPSDAIIAHVPNGGARDARTGALMKRLGAVAGMPDLICFLPGGKFVAFEVKGPSGYASKVQRELWTRFKVLGFPLALVRSVEETRNALKALGITTRESFSKGE